MPVAILATVPGGAPYSERIEVKLLPGPAARITIEPAVTRLVAGQRFHLRARVLTATGDEREGDVVTWSSSNPAMLRVSGGQVTAVSPGSVTVTARSGAASESRPIQVIPASGLTVSVSPSTVTVRQGDVVRFSVDTRDARGQRVTGLTPRWSFPPATVPSPTTVRLSGTYQGPMSSPPTWARTARKRIVTLTDRDVRRNADVVGRLPRSAFYTSEVGFVPGRRQAPVPRRRSVATGSTPSTSATPPDLSSPIRSSPIHDR